MTPRTLAKAISVALILANAACTQAVLVRTEGPRGSLEIDGEPVGVVDERGLEVGVPRGTDPVPYAIEGDDGVRYEGVLERENINLWVAVPAMCGASVCSPTLTAAGALIANPLIPIVVLTSCSLAPVTGLTCAGPAAVLSNPSCLTLPVACAGGVIGLSPLAALPLSENVPEVVTLRPTAVRGERDDAAGVGGEAEDAAGAGQEPVDVDAAPDAEQGVSY